MVTNEGEPLHTVTIHIATYGFHLNTQFDTGEAAHEYARTQKTLNPAITVNVTDAAGGCVELEENGWSRVNA